MKSQSSAPHLAKFQMVKGESLVELEGTVTTPPVLQHAGVSTWPGICRTSSWINFAFALKYVLKLLFAETPCREVNSY